MATYMKHVTKFLDAVTSTRQSKLKIFTLYKDRISH